MGIRGVAAMSRWVLVVVAASLAAVAAAVVARVAEWRWGRSLLGPTAVGMSVPCRTRSSCLASMASRGPIQHRGRRYRGVSRVMAARARQGRRSCPRVRPPRGWCRLHPCCGRGIVGGRSHVSPTLGSPCAERVRESKRGRGEGSEGVSEGWFCVALLGGLACGLAVAWLGCAWLGCCCYTHLQ